MWMHELSLFWDIWDWEHICIESQIKEQHILTVSSSIMLLYIISDSEGRRDTNPGDSEDEHIYLSIWETQKMKHYNNIWVYDSEDEHDMIWDSKDAWTWDMHCNYEGVQVDSVAHAWIIILERSNVIVHDSKTLLRPFVITFSLASITHSHNLSTSSIVKEIYIRPYLVMRFGIFCL